MTDSIQRILEKAILYTDDQPYSLVKLPSQAITAAASIVAEIGQPFSALIVDKDEVSILAPSQLVSEFSTRLRDHMLNPITYRLITFDIELEPDLVGFIAYVSVALADAGISILPYAAYSRDHLFVSEEQFDETITVLKNLQSSN